MDLLEKVHPLCSYCGDICPQLFVHIVVDCAQTVVVSQCPVGLVCHF